MRYSVRRRRLYEKLRARSHERVQERKHNRSRSRSRSLRRKQMTQRRGPEPRRHQRRQSVQTPNPRSSSNSTPQLPPPSSATTRRRTNRHVQARYTQSLQALQTPEPAEPKQRTPTINLSVFGYLVSDRNTQRHRSLRAAIEREGYDPVFYRLDYLATKYQDRGEPGAVLQQDVEWLEKYKERLDHRKLILEERTQTKKKRLRSLSRKRERSLERRSRRKPAVQARGQRRKVY